MELSRLQLLASLPFYFAACALELLLLLLLVFTDLCNGIRIKLDDCFVRRDDGGVGEEEKIAFI